MKIILLVLVALTQMGIHCYSQTGLYFPERVTQTGFREAKQARVGFAVKPTQGRNESVFLNPNADIAVSVSPHLSLYVAYNALLSRGVDFESKLSEGTNYYGYGYGYGYRGKTYYSGHRVELAAGYYRAFAKRGHVEIFAGYGNGSRRSLGDTGSIITENYPLEISFVNYNIRARYHNFIIQAASGLSSEYFSIVGGCKYTLMRFSEFMYQDADIVGLVKKEYKPGIIMADNYSYVQPYINFEAGPRFVKFNSQIGISQRIKEGALTGNPMFYMTFGMALNISKKVLP